VVPSQAEISLIVFFNISFGQDLFIQNIILWKCKVLYNILGKRHYLGIIVNSNKGTLDYISLIRQKTAGTSLQFSPLVR
jgi:hypothetical protein